MEVSIGETYKILNLYACLGGNRYKWDEVAKTANIKIQVTAVELDPELIRLYKERFPNDIVIQCDAHQYLLEHYKDFDFIWSSPPCPSHSKTNNFLNAQGVIRYPDMKLYEEIILLKHFYSGKYCIENVVPYYNPLIPAQKRDRHLYWCNFKLPTILSDRLRPSLQCKGDNRTGLKKDMSIFHEIDLSSYSGNQDLDKIARNLVDYEAGKTILETVFNIKKQQDIKQGQLFNL
jgi:DNA (cytosine-5)-methyltransferase 1